MKYMSKLVFLGIDLEPSIEAESYIKKMDCDLLVSHTKREKFYDFPDEYDVGLAFMYRNLVPKKELKKAKWINIHPAPLPSYGGRNVAYHAILNKEKSFGASIHYMSEDFDKGDIISTSWFDIPENITANELYDLSCQESLKMVKEFLPKILSGEVFSAEKQIEHRYYDKCEINDFIELNDESKTKIRALYCPPHYPKIKIGNRNFNIVLEK
tara:strand:+ start:573 stop:1208 length:636 start_codon:yes stop_codon:yes gene_type:complete